MQKVIISTSNTTVIISSAASKTTVKEAPYKVNLAKVTGKWVDGKYKTTVETLSVGMSNDPLINEWCKMKNEKEGSRTKEMQVSFMLLTDELVERMKE